MGKDGESEKNTEVLSQRSTQGKRDWFSASVVLMVLKQCWSSQPHFLLTLSHAMNDEQQQANKQKTSDNRLIDRSLARPGRRLQSLEVHFPASAVCWLGWLRLFGGREREVQLILSVECRAWEQRSLRPESAPSSVGVRC